MTINQKIEGMRCFNCLNLFGLVTLQRYQRREESFIHGKVLS